MCVYFWLFLGYNFNQGTRLWHIWCEMAIIITNYLKWQIIKVSRNISWLLSKSISLFEIDLNTKGFTFFFWRIELIVGYTLFFIFCLCPFTPLGFLKLEEGEGISLNGIGFHSEMSLHFWALLGPLTFNLVFLWHVSIYNCNTFFCEKASFSLKCLLINGTSDACFPQDWFSKKKECEKKWTSCLTDTGNRENTRE